MSGAGEARFYARHVPDDADDERNQHDLTDVFASPHLCHLHGSFPDHICLIMHMKYSDDIGKILQ